MPDLNRTRLILQRLVQKAERSPANSELAWEIAEYIDALCNEAENISEPEGFDLLWLVADELIPHYEIIEAESQVYESLEGWASVVAGIVGKMRLSTNRNQYLQQQIRSWDALLDGMNLREPLEPLLTKLDNSNNNL